ncbi:uncharacterized protein LOC126839075 isoform X2 [Adelges cooleyi]|uniref:uncharacterized protein LOC126839075 isoform X2 n=1 Tax=Adelges cooleyi TaxID=133065 RepID=UPI00217FC320|nr:uncharacterized protein LOC126839075 isoform X2 [Adelges cooleyi]
MGGVGDGRPFRKTHHRCISLESGQSKTEIPKYWGRRNSTPELAMRKQALKHYRNGTGMVDGGCEQYLSNKSCQTDMLGLDKYLWRSTNGGSDSSITTKPHKKLLKRPKVRSVAVHCERRRQSFTAFKGCQKFKHVYKRKISLPVRSSAGEPEWLLPKLRPDRTAAGGKPIKTESAVRLPKIPTRDLKPEWDSIDTKAVKLAAVRSMSAGAEKPDNNSADYQTGSAQKTQPTRYYDGSDRDGGSSPDSSDTANTALDMTLLRPRSNKSGDTASVRNTRNASTTTTFPIEPGFPIVFSCESVLRHPVDGGYVSHTESHRFSVHYVPTVDAGPITDARTPTLMFTSGDAFQDHKCLTSDLISMSSSRAETPVESSNSTATNERNPVVRHTTNENTPSENVLTDATNKDGDNDSGLEKLLRDGRSPETECDSINSSVSQDILKQNIASSPDLCLFQENTTDLLVPVIRIEEQEHVARLESKQTFAGETPLQLEKREQKVELMENKQEATTNSIDHNTSMIAHQTETNAFGLSTEKSDPEKDSDCALRKNLNVLEVPQSDVVENYNNYNLLTMPVKELIGRAPIPVYNNDRVLEEVSNAAESLSGGFVVEKTAECDSNGVQCLNEPVPEKKKRAYQTVRQSIVGEFSKNDNNTLMSVTLVDDGDGKSTREDLEPPTLKICSNIDEKHVDSENGTTMSVNDNCSSKDLSLTADKAKTQRTLDASQRPDGNIQKGILNGSQRKGKGGYKLRDYLDRPKDCNYSKNCLYDSERCRCLDSSGRPTDRSVEQESIRVSEEYIGGFLFGDTYYAKQQPPSNTESDDRRHRKVNYENLVNPTTNRRRWINDRYDYYQDMCLNTGLEDCTVFGGAEQTAIRPVASYYSQLNREEKNTDSDESLTDSLEDGKNEGTAVSYFLTLNGQQSAAVTFTLKLPGTLETRLNRRQSQLKKHLHSFTIAKKATTRVRVRHKSCQTLWTAEKGVQAQGGSAKVVDDHEVLETLLAGMDKQRKVSEHQIRVVDGRKLVSEGNQTDHQATSDCKPSAQQPTAMKDFGTDNALLVGVVRQKKYKGKEALEGAKNDRLLTLSKGWINFYTLRSDSTDTESYELLDNDEEANLGNANQQYTVHVQATPEPVALPVVHVPNRNTLQATNNNRSATKHLPKIVQTPEPHHHRCTAHSANGWCVSVNGPNNMHMKVSLLPDKQDTHPSENFNESRIETKKVALQKRNNNYLRRPYRNIRRTQSTPRGLLSTDVSRAETVMSAESKYIETIDTHLLIHKARRRLSQEWDTVAQNRGVAECVQLVVTGNSVSNKSPQHYATRGHQHCSFRRQSRRI